MRILQFAFTRPKGYLIASHSIQKLSTTMRKAFAPLSVIFGTLLLANPSLSQSPAGFTSGPATSAPAAPTPNTTRHSDDYDPLLDLPPLERRTVTLIGGQVVSLDEVMNHMVLQPFGTKQKLRVHFDTRTHFYRDGKPITEREVKQGQRVYLDTQLNGDRVFARTIWIRTTAESGIGRGQIIDFDPEHKVVTVRDELSNESIRLQLTPTSVVRKENQPASESDLVQGALVGVEFGAQKEVRAITILASPGSIFTFAGRVTYVDLSQKIIALDNRSDGKKYDVSMDAIAPSVLRQVREGEEVSVSAVFDGNRYAARSLNLSAAQAQPQ